MTSCCMPLVCCKRAIPFAWEAFAWNIHLCRKHKPRHYHRCLGLHFRGLSAAPYHYGCRANQSRGGDPCRRPRWGMDSWELDLPNRGKRGYVADRDVNAAHNILLKARAWPSDAKHPNRDVV